MNSEASIAGGMRDSIGIAMSKTNLLRMNLKKSHIKGVVCSTNNIPLMVRSKASTVDCNEILNANEKF